MTGYRSLFTTKLRNRLLIVSLFILNAWSIQSETLFAKDAKTALLKSIGRQDAVLVANPADAVMVSKNADKKLIPASTLKILTSLAGFHHLGLDFRFRTEFSLDSASNLKIKGYGDPLLISEVIAHIADALRKDLYRFNDLIVDDTYFDQPLTVPGITSSHQPYDSPNGALCVNFNTVYFKKSTSGKYISAEPQTPLLPYVRKKIEASKLPKGRIIFSHERNEIVLYAGHMFQYFLNQSKVRSNNKIRIGKVKNDTDRLIYRHLSLFSMEQLVSKLMAHSNNFIANQILIAAGANLYGPPGTLDKGIRAMRSFSSDVLQLHHLNIVEGSGISRKNRLSATMMFTVLKHFKPYYKLMRYENGMYYKTGTLHGISTRAGYIEKAPGELFPFVVFLNTKGKSAAKMMRRIQKVIR